MSEPETAQPNSSRGLFLVAAGRDDASPQSSETRGVQPEYERQTSFDRKELRIIFDLYGAKVAAGEWRDYALDFLPHRAVFSIFRRASEAPLYQIEKVPALARKQGAYSVIATSGLVLRRGQDLARVIGVLDRKLRVVKD